MESDFNLILEHIQSGSELGLSLVAAVARMHNLNLVLEDANPGLRVRLKNFKLVRP